MDFFKLRVDAAHEHNVSSPECPTNQAAEAEFVFVDVAVMTMLKTAELLWSDHFSSNM